MSSIVNLFSACNQCNILVVNTYVTLREVFRYNLVWALEIKNCFCCLIIPSLML